MSNDNINISFKNTVNGVVYDKNGNITSSISEQNILTDNAKEILNRNLMEDVDELAESNKVIGVVFSNKKFVKSPELTISDIVDGSDTTDVVAITAKNYLGTGSVTYGCRYSFSVGNATGSDVLYQTFGLVTGFSIDVATSYKMLSVLNCNINIPDGGTFVGDYIITVSLKR